MDQSFNGIRQFDIQPPIRDTADNTVKNLSYMILHILGFFKFIYFSLSLVSTPLHCARAGTHIPKYLFVMFYPLIGKATSQILLDNAVYLKIRIAPYR